MLLTIALLMLLAWLVGVTVYEAGTFVHVLLLSGLMLLLLAVIKGRDAAAAHANRSPGSNGP